MGLRGAGAKKPIILKATTPAWKRKTSRVERIIAFLQSLPITKGILAGKRMRLLPGQRKFIERVYGDMSRDGRHQIELRSSPRHVAPAKQDCWQGSRCVICSARNANSAAKSIPALIRNNRPR